MDTISDGTGLPYDIEAQPLVRAAIDMKPKLRKFAAEIEREQRFPPELKGMLTEAGFYRMTIPRALGGLETDTLTFLRVVETLAESVGSIGWNCVNNGVIQLVTLGLSDDGIQEIYGGGKGTVIAGTAVQGGGTAVQVDGGYQVTGRWSFGSGCQEASWMLSSFQILDDGKPRVGPAGEALFWRGLFRRDEIEVVPGSWNVTGMRGTGSFDWTVKDLFLPEHRTMVHAGAPLENQWARWPGIVYALPIQCWIGPHHSSILTGISRGGVDALIDLTTEKYLRGRPGMLRDNQQVQDAIGRADSLLNAGRVYRSQTIREMWDTLAAGKEITLTQRARCRLASSNAADGARAALDHVYRWGGSTSFKAESRLAEAWRDAQVVGQTQTVGPEWYPIAGRALMGMDPGSRLR